MTETIKHYIQLIEYQEQIEKYKKEFKELSNMDIVFNTLDFSLLQNYLEKLGWKVIDKNEFYLIFGKEGNEDYLSFVINKEISNWGENIDKNIKALSKIQNIDIKEIIKNIFD